MNVREMIISMHAPKATPEFMALHERMQDAFSRGDAGEVEKLFQECMSRPESDGECIVCGSIICPYGEPLHYHHDGCPACDGGCT